MVNVKNRCIRVLKLTAFIVPADFKIAKGLSRRRPYAAVYLHHAGGAFASVLHQTWGVKSGRSCRITCIELYCFFYTLTQLRRKIQNGSERSTLPRCSLDRVRQGSVLCTNILKGCSNQIADSSCPRPCPSAIGDPSVSRLRRSAGHLRSRHTPPRIHRGNVGMPQTTTYRTPRMPRSRCHVLFNFHATIDIDFLALQTAYLLFHVWGSLVPDEVLFSAFLARLQIVS